VANPVREVYRRDTKGDEKKSTNLMINSKAMLFKQHPRKIMPMQPRMALKEPFFFVAASGFSPMMDSESEGGTVVLRPTQKIKKTRQFAPYRHYLPLPPGLPLPHLG